MLGDHCSLYHDYLQYHTNGYEEQKQCPGSLLPKPKMC
jgi:hypothetical protein